MAKFKAKQLLKEKKFWFASILIAWAAALQNTSSIDLKLHSDVLAMECAKFDHLVGNNQEGSSTAAAAQKSTVNGVLVNSSSNGGNSSGADRLQMTAVLRHNSGISLDWTPEEKSTLEEGRIAL